MFCDSHAHLDDARFNKDRVEVITQLQESGCPLIINVGADMRSSASSIKLAHQHGFIYASAGVHPHYAKDMSEENISDLRQMAQEPKTVAIGEIGLDYHYDNSPRDKQKFWFRRQIELAKELGMPIIVHCREANEDCMDIVREMGHYGVFHCFAGSVEMAQELINMGYYISFAGVITYKNVRKAVEVAQIVPMDRFLIETDSPYLAPEGHRGERNSPLYVRAVAEEIARIKGIAVEEVARIALENTKSLFRI